MVKKVMKIMNMIVGNKFLFVCVYIMSSCLIGSDGAYFPNFGFVGCYRYTKDMEKYSHYEDASISKDSGETNLSFTHRCIQTCLLQSRKYAGFKKDARCFCGDTYNQTFAVDQSRCSYEESCMTIYNTDYEMKPLLSVPGNNSNILEVWETNSTGKYNAIFVENIMRNPVIDQWKDRRLYHIPEYVKLLTLNKHGQWLWWMDFFTNESTADMKSWMNVTNILSDESMDSVSGISLGQDILAIHNGNHSVYFLHGDILKEGSDSRVTVFTQNKRPQSVLTSMQWGIKENVSNDTYNNCQTRCAELAGFIFENDKQQRGNCYCINSNDQMQYNTSIHQLHPFWKDSHLPSACPIKHRSDQTTCQTDCSDFHFMMYNITDETCLCFDKASEDTCNLTLQIKPNYGHQEMEWMYFTIEKTKSLENISRDYVCGIRSFNSTGNLTCEPPQQLQLTVWIKEELMDVMTINWNHIQNTFYFDDCIFTNKTKLEILGFDCKENDVLHFSLLTIKERSLVIADRVVILGYYHKEEPKVSKWEYLNNFTYEEIQNIMRPVLENTRTEGTVPVQNLSSSIRKKESAPDHRKSSQRIGILGGFLLGFTFIIMFISDVMTLKVHLAAMYKNLSRLFKVPKKSRG